MRHFVIAMLCLVCPIKAQEVIRCKGSDTLGAKLIPVLSEAYKSKHPGLKFEIAAEGTSTAFTALLQGTADIGMANREIKPEEARQFEEKGIKLDCLLIGQDLLCIIVNEKNPVDALSRQQVESVFTGDSANWKAVGGRDLGIRIHTRNTASGTARNFKQLVMRGRDFGASANRMHLSPPAQLVAADEQGISWVGLAYVKSKGIKVLKIDGTAPSADNAKTYAYSQPLYLFLRSDTTGPARDFATWAARSDEAKEIVGKIGFVPPK